MRAKILSFVVLMAFMSNACTEEPAGNTSTPVEFDTAILRVAVNNLRKSPIRQIIFKGSVHDKRRHP